VLGILYLYRVHSFRLWACIQCVGNFICVLGSFFYCWACIRCIGQFIFILGIIVVVGRPHSGRVESMAGRPLSWTGLWY
jgi:hypothetical protein